MPTTTASSPRSRLRLLALINVAAGLWLITVPFVLDLPRTYPHQLTFFNFLLSGAAVLILSILHALQWSELRRASWGNVMVGIWLAASPVVFGSTKYLTNAKTVALISVLTGLVVVAGAALCLAGSDDEAARPRPLRPARSLQVLPASGTIATATGPLGAAPLPRPALWPPPRVGEQPAAFRGQADDGDTGEAAARRKLPLAWTAVVGLIAAAALLGLALVLQSLVLGVSATALGLVSAALAWKVRILSAVSLGRSPEGP